jgi:hypothetical protein
MGGYWGTKAEGEGEQDPKGSETTVEATLCYTFSSEGKSTTEAQQAYLAEVDRLGYKIGLRVRAEVNIRAFRFLRERGEVELVASDDVTQDLARTFGSPEGEKWLGFRPSSRERRRYHFPEPCVICYDMILTLSPPPRLPLLIPIVIRRDNQHSFGESCIAGLLVIRARRQAKA